jgi:hypothetical protein
MGQYCYVGVYQTKKLGIVLEDMTMKGVNNVYSFLELFYKWEQLLKENLIDELLLGGSMVVFSPLGQDNHCD